MYQDYWRLPQVPIKSAKNHGSSVMVNEKPAAASIRRTLCNQQIPVEAILSGIRDNRETRHMLGLVLLIGAIFAWVQDKVKWPHVHGGWQTGDRQEILT
jgi:hypothetical protein